MSGSYQVIFQSKGSDGIECTSDMVLMLSGDMKQLKLKSGGFVTIESNNKILLCRAWASKKSSAGTITLNKIWSSNFGNDSKKATVVVCNSPRVVRCSSIKLKMCNSENNISLSLKNYDFIVPLLGSAPVRVGTLISFSLRGFPLVAEITETVSENDAADNFQQLTPTTSVKFDFNCSHSTSSCSSTERSSNSISNRVLSVAGYEAQQRICLKHARLALEQDNNSKNNSIKSYFEEQLFKPPKGLLLFGPPGTGKTRLMQGLVQSLGCASLEITPSILMSNVDGESEQSLRHIFQEAQRLAPCCILIDNMDLVCAQRSKADVSDLQKRIVSCLLTLLDGVTDMQKVFVIGTSCKPSDIDSAIRRSGRIDKEVEIGVPSALERHQILSLLLQEAGITITTTTESTSVSKFSVPASLIKEIASLAHGMVGADLLLIVKEAFYLATKRRSKNSNTSSVLFHQDVNNDVVSNLADEFGAIDMDSTVDATFSTTTASSIQDAFSDSTTANITESHSSFFIENDFREALASVSPSALREVVIEVPQVHWTDIGGMEMVKQSLREVVEWPLQHPELFRSLNISPPKGVLLFGPPGCSKTLMAKALATESSMNFLAVRGPELLSKWLGDSEKAVQTLFRRARAAAPSIIFFDEIDALAGKRGASSSGVSDRVLSQLLTELDGIQGLKQVVVIAATNRPDMLDAALIRPGRIDRKIYVPPPDDESREQILRLELKKVPISSIISYSKLVALTRGFSGAECVAVCTEASMLAVEEGQMYLSEEHLLHAISEIKPQITQEMLTFYETLKL